MCCGLLYLRTVDYCSGRALLVRREALEAAGWPGAEVALDWADVELGFAFGYTVNQMGPGAPADPRSVALVEAVRTCL